MLGMSIYTLNVSVEIRVPLGANSSIAFFSLSTISISKRLGSIASL